MARARGPEPLDTHRREEAETPQGLHSLIDACETFNETIADPVGFEPIWVQNQFLHASSDDNSRLKNISDIARANSNLN